MSRDFARYQNTPIITKGTGVWDETDIAAPYVFFDSIHGSRWVCAYSAYSVTTGANGTWSFALAYSPYNAGLTYGGLEGPWTKEAANPVFSPSAAKEGYISCNGWVAIVGSTYYHFYNGANNGTTGSFQIFLATSPDLLTWTRQNSGDPVLDWVTGVAADPQGYVDSSNRFVMQYIRDMTGMSTREYWRAISTNGIHWTHQMMMGAPAMSTTNNGEPSFILNADGTMRMMADSSDGSPDNGRRLVDSWSEDGRVWGVRRNRLLKSANSWETGQVFDSALVKYLTKACLFYAGSTGIQPSQGMLSQIGLAVADWVEDRT